MTEYVQVGDLQVARVLFDFVQNEATPEPASTPLHSGPVRTN